MIIMMHWCILIARIGMHKKILGEIIYYENATDNYFAILLIFEIN